MISSQIPDKMDIYGLLGKKLGHSYSPKFFNERFKKLGINAQYLLFEFETVEKFVEQIGNNINLKGFNITIPFKKNIIKHLATKSLEVNETGSCNLVKLVEGKMAGYNTDIFGFEKSLFEILDSQVEKALILGNGGSAQSVKYILGKHDIKYEIASRQKGETLHYDELTKSKIGEFQLIINTTPLGMHPQINDFPLIDYNGICSSHICFDLIYNPDQTVFLQKCARKGARIVNGLKMLEYQAEKAAEIWNI